MQASRLNAHWFRHSHAIHALDKGVPVHLVRATLGQNECAQMTTEIEENSSVNFSN
ncbi:hypothetical protein [Nostoc sp. ChiQUE01b]|uniref:hypothetical protein n=1 Tax=Nostoc sp. ChiQUE01b TaxID=3075376 RepID=UPI002AD4128A|nr:hypothetical protein [Nostoc sp. ChiQUE01b]